MSEPTPEGPSPPAAPGPESRPPERVVLQGLPPRQSPGRRLARWALFAAIGLLNAGLLGGLALYAWFSRGLPSVPTLAEYRPPIITEMVSADGQIAGEFFVERRKVVPTQRIPKPLVQAFIASEDKNFFDHRGVDWLGTVRAAVNTYLLRRKIQGGSTITQQTAKALLISSEGFQQGTRKSLTRKLREAILASRLERAFSKEEILFLYLNGVYLGHHSYGVQSAAENYYRKNVEDLTLPEAALLAGLPQAPSRYSPFAHPEQAKARRRYVLRRMREEGMISEEQRRAAEEAEVKVHRVDDIFRETAPFYVEQVRRQVVDRYGNERMLHDGLRVEMAMDLEAQRAAQGAMLPGLMEVDHRQGWLGPVKRVAGAERDELLARLSQAWPRGSLKSGDYAVGIVDSVNDAEGRALVRAGEEEGILPIAGMRWARKPNSEAYYPDALISRVSTALKPGDVVLVRRVERKELLEREATFRDPKPKLIPESGLLFSLEQEPKLQGALVSIDPWSGYVKAMVGGYDFDASEFNRAFQACRQPGSAFKPIVYTAAFEKLGFTPATLLLDAPLVYRDDESAWKPQNFGESFKGEVTLRDALVHSMNIPAVRTAEALVNKFGIGILAEWARTLGLTTTVKPELGSAIGSSCTTLWDLTGVYALIDRYGEKRPATFLKRVLDRTGQVLEDHVDWHDPWVPLRERLAAALAEVSVERQRVMDEKSAYLAVHLMKEVATAGTGAQAARLGKPAAGKTGTTNDSFDTWFLGFTRHLVTGVWLGYDLNESPLGRYETGGRAALPIWLSYMQRALHERREPDFPIPGGLVMVRIDPQTGKAMAPFDRKGVVEPFVEGTEPVLEAPDKARLQVQDLFAQ
ncbi:MAG TPA: PBP1A family penicillin-binding protein [Anaeromyxobacteraceae bacterium]|nr:PBP1A family penicillin-binding protein [Anaeromyxobacteraceae bacterium]